MGHIFHPEDLTPKGEMHPVQIHLHPHERPSLSDNVTRRAYEAYCEIWAEQQAMVDLEGRGCRGGFSMGEIIALLYARSFSREEWPKRFEEVQHKGFG